MKVLARMAFTNTPTLHDIAIYQDGVGIRQRHATLKLQDDVWLSFDQIETIAKLARKHRKNAERLEARDNAALEA